MPKNKASTENNWHVDPETGEPIDPDDAPDLSTPEWQAKFDKVEAKPGAGEASEEPDS